MSSNMSVEEKFEVLMRQNEIMMRKIHEGNQETQAQNEYLRRQLGSFLKQKQKVNEETLQSEPRRQEQVYSHDIDSSTKDEPLRLARPEPWMQANTTDFKVEIIGFEGKLDLEEFLNWLHTVECVFDYKDAPEDKKVKLVALRHRKYASLWWTNLCAKWVREGKSKIRTLEKMKSKLKAHFLPQLMFKIAIINSIILLKAT